MKKNALESPTITTTPIIKVVHVEVTPEGRTERELTGKELEQWKKEHLTNDNAESEDKPDTK